MSRPRNPQETRRTILDAAFDKVRRQGFQAAGLNDILAESGVTKGAMYHHFPSKMALGYALVDETVKGRIEEWWLRPLEDEADPIAGLLAAINSRLGAAADEMIRLGCPLATLSQEMASVDEEFRQRLEGIYRAWRKGMARAFRRGQQHGFVRGDVDADQAAAFTIAALQGAFGMAKNAQSLDVLRDCLQGLTGYLASLRP
jgi:AcrR family transcriptional regulator